MYLVSYYIGSELIAEQISIYFKMVQYLTVLLQPWDSFSSYVSGIQRQNRSF